MEENFPERKAIIASQVSDPVEAPVSGVASQGEGDPLNWESSYAIALALRAAHPDIPLEEVSLGMIYRWTIELPRFEDDYELANEAILSSIYQEWFEEVNPL